MSPLPLQLVHVDPTVPPVDGDVPVYSAAISQYVPTANVNTDYVVMSNGANPPSPMDDGNGNFIYITYTP